MTVEEGPTVEESIVRLRARGTALFEWRCTPSDLEVMAIGRLYIEGMIDNAALRSDLELEQHANGEIDILLPAGLDAVATPRRRVTARRIPESDELSDLFRILFTTVDARHESGGMHAAALVSGGGIAFQAEDVGRHNTVDKVIGMALLTGLIPAEFGMLVSARVSGEIARKAVQAGVGWLASRSIPTTLAVRIARAGALPIVGRAAGKNAYVYR